MLSLYDATVPSFLQTLRAVQALLVKAEDFCAQNKIAHEDILEARLVPDMLPFTFQVKQVARHTWGGVQGVMTGQAGRDTAPLAKSFAELHEKLAEAEAGLAALAPETLNALEGGEVLFDVPGYVNRFTAPEFLMSFSQPNFHFHATMTYALLRAKGVEIGKLDYLGKMRVL